jgi:hypothetical protein
MAQGHVVMPTTSTPMSFLIDISSFLFAVALAMSLYPSRLFLPEARAFSRK